MGNTHFADSIPATRRCASRGVTVNPTLLSNLFFDDLHCHSGEKQQQQQNDHAPKQSRTNNDNTIAVSCLHPFNITRPDLASNTHRISRGCLASQFKRSTHAQNTPLRNPTAFDEWTLHDSGGTLRLVLPVHWGVS